MRRLFPDPLDPVDPADVYGDPPRTGPGGRPGVRLNMIASVDGATTVAGVSGGLGGGADHDLFGLLRSLADVVLVAADTARAEGHGPSRVPVAVVTRSCRLDWEAPFFTAPVARPIVVTVAGAPPDALARAAEVAEVVVAGDRDVDPAVALDGREIPGTTPLRLRSVCEQDGFLFLRYRPGRVARLPGHGATDVRRAGRLVAAAVGAGQLCRGGGDLPAAAGRGR